MLLFSLAFLVLWAVDKFLVRPMNLKMAKSAVILLILINVILQLLCLNQLKVKPSWDFGAIMFAADDISMGHAIRNWKYFLEYPYNLNTAVLVGAFKLLLGGNQLSPYLLNIAAVTTSILGACLVAFKLYGQRASVLVAFFCLAVTPLYLDIPIVYTDTLSMPFVIWTVYAWTYVQPEKKRSILYCILIGIFSAFGYLIKQIAALGLVAFVFDFIFNRKKYIPIVYQRKGSLLKSLSRMVPLATTFLSFIIIILAFKYYVSFKGFDSRLDSDKKIPYTHWLMMGMNNSLLEGGTSSGYGGFSLEDLKYTRSYKTLLAKKQAELEIIKKRILQFGMNGYFTFLLKKIEWTWTDGTYYVPVKLARHPEKITTLHKFVLFNNGLSNKLYLIFTQFIQVVILSMILIGCIASFRKYHDEHFRFMTLMCMGLMFFLLFWETRSRYLIFMIPVLVVMTVYGMLFAFRGIDKALAYVYRNFKILIYSH